MTEQDAKAWIEELASRQIPVRAKGETMDGSPYMEYDEPKAMEWVTEAEAALHDLLPPGHASLQRWMTIFPRDPKHQASIRIGSNVTAGRAVVATVKGLINSGRLRSLAEGIRAETVSEVLDQAGLLLNENYLVAAAVLVGGALETFLHGLCVRWALTWTGDGSIEKYNQALSQARNAGQTTISVGESKQVTAWGDTRNKAAHDPTTFNPSVEDVRRMLEGVRDFMVKHQ